MKCETINCDEDVAEIELDRNPKYLKWRGKFVCKRCYDELSGESDLNV